MEDRQRAEKAVEKLIWGMTYNRLKKYKVRDSRLASRVGFFVRDQIAEMTDDEFTQLSKNLQHEIAKIIIRAIDFYRRRVRSRKRREQGDFEKDVKVDTDVAARASRLTPPPLASLMVRERYQTATRGIRTLRRKHRFQIAVDQTLRNGGNHMFKILHDCDVVKHREAVIRAVLWLLRNPRARREWRQQVEKGYRAAARAYDENATVRRAMLIAILLVPFLLLAAEAASKVH